MKKGNIFNIKIVIIALLNFIFLPQLLLPQKEVITRSLQKHLTNNDIKNGYTTAASEQLILPSSLTLKSNYNGISSVQINEVTKTNVLISITKNNVIIDLNQKSIESNTIKNLKRYNN